MKEIKFTRQTKDANIAIHFYTDTKTKPSIITPLKFLTQLLQSFSGQGNFSLNIKVTAGAKANHKLLAKDLGLSLGKIFKTYWSGLKGFNGAGFWAFPSDSALGIVALDFISKANLNYRLKFKHRQLIDLDAASLQEFFSGFATGAVCNLVIYAPLGDNDRAKAEAIFKAFGKALQMAFSSNPGLLKGMPSVKDLTKLK